jgi:hypothetical protein
LLVAAAIAGAAAVFFEIAYSSLLPSLVDAAFAIVVDALSYAVSFFTLLPIRVREAHLGAARTEPLEFWTEFRAGISVLRAAPVLVRIVGSTATCNLQSGPIDDGRGLPALRLPCVLHLSPVVAGTLLAVSNLGFAGALFAPRLVGRFGSGRTLVVAMTISMLSQFLARWRSSSRRCPFCSWRRSGSAPAHRSTTSPRSVCGSG